MHSIALPFAMIAGREAPVAASLNLSYSQVCASTNSSRRHQIGLLWERLSQLVDRGFLYSAIARVQNSAGWSPLPALFCRKWRPLVGSHVWNKMPLMVIAGYMADVMKF